MKFSVSSYSYSQLMNKGEKTEKELIALAKEVGFDGIEFAGLRVPEGRDILDYAAELRAECEKYSITPVNYTIGADFLYPASGSVEGEIERLCREVDVARALGVSGMRHDGAGGWRDDRHQRGFADALPIIAKGCRGVTEYAKQYGIRTMMENHGVFCQDSCRVEQIVTTTANDNFGVLIDMGNFLCADEAPEKAVGRLAPFAFHVHAKDFHFKSGEGIAPCNGFFTTRGGNYLRGAIIGHGVVPVYQCLSILKRSGYDGFVSVEFEGAEEAKLGVEWGYNTLKNYSELLGL